MVTKRMDGGGGERICQHICPLSSHSPVASLHQLHGYLQNKMSYFSPLHLERDHISLYYFLNIEDQKYVLFFQSRKTGCFSPPPKVSRFSNDVCTYVINRNLVKNRFMLIQYSSAPLDGLPL